ncbi:hypothetical protein BHE74_00048101, partial [Ensete ventricosum]
IFHTPSRNFKILAIRSILAYKKWYEHGFTKKHNSPKLYKKSRFDRFFVHHLRILKPGPLPTY